MLFSSLPIVLRAERLDIPLAYLANVDLDADPTALDGALGYISMGHDEYWTLPMRKAVTAARDAGTNLAFLSANDIYWRIRLADTVRIRSAGGGLQDRRRGRRPGAVEASRDHDSPLARSATPEPGELPHRNLVRVLPGRRPLRRGVSRLVGISTHGSPGR